jgi:hypothetical protein
VFMLEVDGVTKMFGFGGFDVAIVNAVMLW